MGRVRACAPAQTLALANSGPVDTDALDPAALLARLATAEPVVVARADEPGPGNWVGGPYAARDGDRIALAYRVRKPESRGRGLANIVAVSDDGLAFTPVATITSDSFGAASLERPALVRRPDGGWRLYVSCSTKNSKHWWVEAIDADTLAGLEAGQRTVVLPGDESQAFKDVIVDIAPDGTWRIWACRHPLDGGDDEADRMSTVYGTSADGLAWDLHGPCLLPSPDSWDQRGARVTAVLPRGDEVVALYDGRASADENFFERTGVAVGTPADLHAVGGPVPAAYGRALRYASLIDTPAGLRAYYEVTTDDGSHALVTALLRD